MIEDGSAESVAIDVVRLWDEAKLERLALVGKFEGLADKLKGKRAEVHTRVRKRWGRQVGFGRG